MGFPLPTCSGGGVPQKLMPPPGLQHPDGSAHPTPSQSQCGAGIWGSLMSPALGDSPQQGTWHQGWGGGGGVLTCLGLCCWGLPGSSLGLWGTEGKGVRAFSPLQLPGRTRASGRAPPPFLGGGKGQPFVWLQKQLPHPISTKSSSANSILPSREHRTGSALTKGDSNEVHLGTPPH